MIENPISWGLLVLVVLVLIIRQFKNEYPGKHEKSQRDVNYYIPGASQNLSWGKKVKDKRWYL